MKHLKDVPIRHATGDHSKCSSDWCHARKVQEEGKTYNRKLMFSLPKEDREIDQVKKINNQFTTDQAIHEMNHPFTTQPNKSINMRTAEGAPKHKHFSRSETLQNRVYTTIGIHNMGYATFYQSVARLLSIECPVFLQWNEQRDVRKDKKIIYAKTLEHKSKRAYKAKTKRKEVIYLESIQTPKDGDYKPKKKKQKKSKPKKRMPNPTTVPPNNVNKGHDAILNSNEKDNEEKPKRRRNRKTCDCGQGRVHLNRKYVD